MKDVQERSETTYKNQKKKKKMNEIIIFELGFDLG